MLLAPNKAKIKNHDLLAMIISVVILVITFVLIGYFPINTAAPENPNNSPQAPTSYVAPPEFDTIKDELAKKFSTTSTEINLRITTTTDTFMRGSTTINSKEFTVLATKSPSSTWTTLFSGLPPTPCALTDTLNLPPSMIADCEPIDGQIDSILTVLMAAAGETAVTTTPQAITQKTKVQDKNITLTMPGKYFVTLNLSAEERQKIAEDLKERGFTQAQLPKTVKDTSQYTREDIMCLIQEKNQLSKKQKTANSNSEIGCWTLIPSISAE